jgi:hypothetical protein
MDADYKAWEVDVFEAIEERGYGQLAPDTPQQLQSWLVELVPPLILQRMVCAGAVKVCSTISPVASQVSLEHEMALIVRAVPGHFYNVALTTHGPFKVDLSAIQFEVPKLARWYADHGDEDEDEDEDDPFGEHRAVYELLERVAQNPFDAILVEPLPPTPMSGIAVPYDESFNFDHAKRYVARIRKGRRRTALERLALLREDPATLEALA